LENLTSFGETWQGKPASGVFKLSLRAGFSPRPLRLFFVLVGPGGGHSSSLPNVGRGGFIVCNPGGGGPGIVEDQNWGGGGPGGRPSPFFAWRKPIPDPTQFLNPTRHPRCFFAGSPKPRLGPTALGRGEPFLVSPQPTGRRHGKKKRAALRGKGEPIRQRGFVFFFFCFVFLARL